MSYYKVSLLQGVLIRGAGSSRAGSLMSNYCRVASLMNIAEQGH